MYKCTITYNSHFLQEYGTSKCLLQVFYNIVKYRPTWPACLVTCLRISGSVSDTSESHRSVWTLVAARNCAAAEHCKLSH